MENTNAVADVAVSIRAAHKDYSARGRVREHWYRLVWRDNAWQYFSDGRLPSGNFSASDRHATVLGDVFPGEIVVSHDHGGPIDRAWIVERSEKPLCRCKLEKTRAGLRITTPAGEVIETPNPRK